MAEEIVIRTANPNDITLEEAEEIATAVRGLNLNCAVNVEGKERTGYGVTWFRFCASHYLEGHLGLERCFPRK